MEFELIQGQKVPVTLDSEWIFIEHATDKVQFEIEATGQIFSLTQKSLYKYTGTRFGRIFVSGVGRLVFEHGVGSFTPPIEGQSLAVSSLPAVEIAPNQSVKVQSLPEIQLVANQQVRALIEALPEIALAAGQKVSIDSAPVTRMASNQVIGVQASNMLISQKAELPLDIPRNNERRNIIIKADAANAGALVLNTGFEIGAGEQIELATREALSLTGTVGDFVHIIEV
ncbi:hypothetical protein [Vibrio cyclitrophicus]|uniref:hypothetical protein n=1 Tax=Vibrio cyclitrophicus TaxID=47951 RepID=UPI000C837BF3|nr:hypothetical protein [Vibrio cyclitrophicus]PMH50201.1 hypothetical protein BCU67_16870 [Vibrio cyclitrophicus]